MHFKTSVSKLHIKIIFQRQTAHLWVIHVPDQATLLPRVQDEVAAQELSAALLLLDVQEATDSILPIHVRHGAACSCHEPATSPDKRYSGGKKKTQGTECLAMKTERERWGVGVGDEISFSVWIVVLSLAHPLLGQSLFCLASLSFFCHYSPSRLGLG